ncbi:lysophospholipid acyltransferase family protein [Sinimarinibacterium thermocellulolyticum]|uniref:Lysophospholipid acyltransferase family protein n=1 Tax=Sinimarinibacterium thermocellulolyticum TaxID=3170016 RepID=A0ABV2AD45_9GAMM
MHTRLRLCWRAARLIVHIAAGLAAALALRLDPSGRLQPEPIAQRWSRRLLRILDIRVRVCGTPVAGARLTVANHVSWLDIPLLAACAPTRFVAKSEIRDWPLAGGLASAAGTFYIRRGKGGARPVVDRLVPYLAGACAAQVAPKVTPNVTLFPEGTTTDGRQVLDFHARLFAAAIEAGVPVQPAALRYGCDAEDRDLAPFVGDDDLFRHILRLLRSRGLQAELIWCAPIPSAQAERGALAAEAEQAVRAALQLNAPAPGRQGQREAVGLAAA